jgi:hypothetical protein
MLTRPPATHFGRLGLAPTHLSHAHLPRNRTRTHWLLSALFDHKPTFPTAGSIPMVTPISPNVAHVRRSENHLSDTCRSLPFIFIGGRTTRIKFFKETKVYFCARDNHFDPDTHPELNHLMIT